MSLNRSFPFELCSRNDYLAWYEVINSIIGFVTASTNLASTLKDSKCYFPEMVEIKEVHDETSSKEYNLIDFPWFVNHITQEENETLAIRTIFKIAPPFQYDTVDTLLLEPNLIPRSCITNLEEVGDVVRQKPNSPNVEENQIVRSEESTDSCFFKEFSDSEQTIESTNFQDIFEKQDEIKSKRPEFTQTDIEHCPKCKIHQLNLKNNSRVTAKADSQEKEAICKENYKKLICEVIKNESILGKNTSTIVCKRYPEKENKNKITRQTNKKDYVDFVEKNIVSTKNVITKRASNIEKKYHLIYSQNNCTKPKCINNKKSLSLDQVKPESNSPKPKTVKLTCPKADLPDKLKICSNASTRSSDIKGCLKQPNQHYGKEQHKSMAYDNKTSKLVRPKTPILKLEKHFTEVPITCNNTLKLSAAETLKKADKLLKIAEDNVLKSAKVKNIPKIARPLTVLKK